MNKKYVAIGLVAVLLASAGGAAYYKKTHEASINVLGTTDIHGATSRAMIKYVEDKRKNGGADLVVDSGDFWGSETYEMQEWFDGTRPTFDENGRVRFYGKDLDGDGFNETDSDINGDDIPDMIVEKIGEPREGQAPLIRDLEKMKFDSVTLGNHEFVENSQEEFDYLVNELNKANISVLSANLYNNKTNKNVVKPYIIKEIKEGPNTIKAAVLGLTLPEVAEPYKWEEGKERPTYTGDYSLASLEQYNNQYRLDDLVKEANKWTKYIKENENTDVVILTVHSGEEPKKPRHPGNRVKEIARTVEGIDAIVAGHTHITIQQHEFKNEKTGKKVLVTQPSARGGGISDIDLNLKKKNGKWTVVSAKSKVHEFDIFDGSKVDYEKTPMSEVYKKGYRL